MRWRGLASRRVRKGGVKRILFNEGVGVGRWPEGVP